MYLCICSHWKPEKLENLNMAFYPNIYITNKTVLIPSLTPTPAHSTFISLKPTSRVSKILIQGKKIWYLFILDREGYCILLSVFSHRNDTYIMDNIKCWVSVCIPWSRKGIRFMGYWIVATFSMYSSTLLKDICMEIKWETFERGSPTNQYMNKIQ